MSNFETKTEFLFTTKQAIAFVNAADAKALGDFYVMIRMDARIEDDPSKVYSDGLVSSIKLSKSEAKKLVSRLLSPVLESKGARIYIEQIKYEHSDKMAFWIR